MKAGTAAKPVSRKKDEDVDTSPLVQVNNLKNQRSIDEQKLKVVKTDVGAELCQRHLSWSNILGFTFLLGSQMEFHDSP